MTTDAKMMLELADAVRREIKIIEDRHPKKFLEKSLSGDALQWQRLTAALAHHEAAALPQEQGAGERLGEQQILDEANRRYPHGEPLSGSYRRAFVEGAGWGSNNRAALPQEQGAGETTPQQSGKKR
jgi:hypothetical protein